MDELNKLSEKLKNKNLVVNTDGEELIVPFYNKGYLLIQKEDSLIKIKEVNNGQPEEKETFKKSNKAVEYIKETVLRKEKEQRNRNR